jgi:hypothetical protein
MTGFVERGGPESDLDGSCSKGSTYMPVAAFQVATLASIWPWLVGK